MRRRRKREDEDVFDVDDFFADDLDDGDLDAIKSGEGLGLSADPAVVLYPERYCPVVESLPLECYEVR